MIAHSKGLAQIVAVCFIVCNSAFAQWPGQTSGSSQGDSGGWPGESKNRNYVPPNADKFACAFNYAKISHAMSFLEMRPSGKPLCPSGGTNLGSYFSGNRLSVLSELIKSTGVREDRIIAIEKAGFRNAAAMQCEAADGEIKQLVIWDSEYLGGLDRQAGTKWASVAVLAHELAHHHNNDTGQNPGRIPPHERREQELYADRWAGQKLGEFGASRDEAVAVFRLMGEGGETHPPSNKRVAAAGEGWDRTSGGTRSGRPPENPPGGRGYHQPPPPRLGYSCSTPVGVCPMSQPIPVGQSCYCLSHMGPIYGLAR